MRTRIVLFLVLFSTAGFWGMASAQSAIFVRPLILGSHGADVSILQKTLKTEGYFTYPQITGYYGSVTAKAVANFQRAHGFEAVGYVGPLTRTVLNNLTTSSNTSLAQTPSTSVPIATTTPLVPFNPTYVPSGGYTPGFGGGGDTIAPVITLSGTNPMTVAQGSTFTDPGASATDNVDGTVSVSISGTVNTATLGTYTLTYTATDRAHNTATITRTVNVTDQTAPVISAISSATPSATIATTTWTTNEGATSQVVYGLTSSYGNTTTLNSALTTSHQVVLTGLSAVTTYHYAVVSTDTYGNIATSSDQTFITSPSWITTVSGVAPTLYADFTTEGSTNHYWYSNSSYGSASALLTAMSGSFARSSTAYGQTSAGSLTSFGSGVMRLTDLGLLIENSATNLGFPSEQGASFFVSSTNASIANSSTVGPNGSATFYSTASTTAAGGNRQKNVTVTNDSATYEDSIFVASKSGGQTVRWLAGLVGGTGKQSFVDFNITTGVITAGTGVVQAVSGGWRVSVSITNNSTGNTTLYSEFFPGGGSGSGIADFGGFQLEKTSVLSSYIQTTSAAVPRAADVLTRTGGADLSASSGEVDISAHTSVGTSTQILWQRDDGTQNNRFTIYRDTSRFVHFVIVAGGITQSDRTIQVIADDTDFTVSMAWSGTLASYTINSGVPFIEAAVTLPAGITTERLGEDTSGNQWGGRIKTIASYPSATISTLTFYDSFNRADTAAGVMSNPPVGNAYGFYGPWVSSYPLPAATNGYISSKGFVEDQNNATYMEQNLGHPVTSATAKLSWTPNSGSTGNATATFLIYNTAGNIDSAIHVQVYTTNMVLQKRVNGAFTTLASLAFPSHLSKDGTIHDASVIISGSTVTVTVDGMTISATDPFFATVDGNYIAWENYMIDAVDALKIPAVSAQ